MSVVRHPPIPPPALLWTYHGRAILFPRDSVNQRVALSQANLSLGFPSKSSLFAWGNSPKLKTKAAWGKASEGKLQISLGRSLGARRAWGRRHGGDVAACRCGICHALQWHI